MAAKDAGLFRGGRPADVFHVNVKNTIAEAIDKLNVVHTLIAKVTRVVIKAKSGMAIQRFDGALRGGYIKRDFRWMNFEGKFDV